jgi:protein-disulfide isomerase
MRALLLAGAILTGAVAAQAAAAPKRSAAPAARDWTRTVSATPEGGYRVGNPTAAVKLVEYGSLTCNHCATFAKEGMPPLLSRHVRTGRVSYEFRTFVLNGIDATATLLAHCAGPARFFELTDALYRSQEQWLGKAAGFSDQQKAQIQAAPEAQRPARVADMIGLTQAAAAHGVTPARGKQCLADPAGLQRLDRMIQAGTALGVQGTPTFFINGRKVAAHDWASLEPLLKTGS